MARDPKATSDAKRIEFLLSANHGSPLEHVSATFVIKNVSRSFLAQITRHRMASYTTSSQHYQDYRLYPAIISPSMIHDPAIQKYFDQIMDMYVDLCTRHPHHEARQILPNGMAVNIEWTINARSLANFINLRICKRNTEEMLVFTKKLRKFAIAWFPALFNHVHADCVMKGRCSQGRMSCGDPYEKDK
jgi:thymidylate synthase (FAD)